MEFGRALYDRWNLDPEVAFLNHGSFGACPKVVLEEQTRLRLEMERAPVRFLDPRFGHLDAAVTRVAEFLRCDPEGLGFVDNATTAVNAVVRSLPFQPGDAILTTTHAYGAVANCLHWVADRFGARVIEVPLPFPVSSQQQVIERVVEALRAPGIRLAVLDHITSATGLVLPIEELVAACREAGVPVLVDGAHAPGHLPLDLGALGADWYTGNLHKWLFAPKGCAVLYTAPERRAQTHPTVISWGLGEGYRAEFDWQGTRDITAFLAAPAGVAFMESLGTQRVWQHNRDLADRMANRLAAEWGVERPAPADMCGNLVTLPLPFQPECTKEAACAVNDGLYTHHRIEVPVVPFRDRVWIRISAQVYNSEQDYERLARAISSRGLAVP